MALDWLVWRQVTDGGWLRHLRALLTRIPIKDVGEFLEGTRGRPAVKLIPATTRLKAEKSSPGTFRAPTAKLSVGQWRDSDF